MGSALKEVNGNHKFEPHVIPRDDETLLIRAEHVRVGDMLDLEGDVYANPHKSNPIYEMEYATVIERRVTAYDDCDGVEIHFDEGYCFAPEGHEFVLAPEYGLLRAAYDGLTRGGFEYGTPQYAAALDAFKNANDRIRKGFYESLEAADMDRRAEYCVESQKLFDAASAIAKGYITTALWCGVEYRSGDPRGDSDRANDLNPDDLTPDTIRQMIADADGWAAEHADLIAAVKAAGFRCGPDYDQDGHLGHDLWLTSNGHGAGFWDGDYPEPFATQLDDAAKKLGEHSLFVTDDGAVEIMGD